MTGYAQVYGRASLTHEEKIDLDLYYVDNRSVVMDIKIILKTVAMIFSRRGQIYERRYSDSKERESD